MINGRLERSNRSKDGLNHLPSNAPSRISPQEIIKQVLVVNRPTLGNQKTFFGAMLVDISFNLRRACMVNLAESQIIMSELKDDLISTRKWKK